MSKLNAVQIASRFYDARDSLRRAFPDRYESIVEPWRVGLRRLMAARGCGVLDAALLMLKEGERRDVEYGMASIIILTATADVCDGEADA